MIVIAMENRCIGTISSNGHSGFSDTGNDIVCAAVSSLLRTFAHTLERSKGVRITGSADEPGTFHLEIKDITPEISQWFQGVSDFLIRGLQDVCQDYPDFCSLEIR